mmetsp:Transcript_43946/g.78982  ORF Transcript_43946/g.78982 Transcript_43946/m.78982 type:complete len:143 (-) Transcript_43946:70-498(-)
MTFLSGYRDDPECEGFWAGIRHMWFHIALGIAVAMLIIKCIQHREWPTKKVVTEVCFHGIGFACCLTGYYFLFGVKTVLVKQGIVDKHAADVCLDDTQAYWLGLACTISGLVATVLTFKIMASWMRPTAARTQGMEARLLTV